MIYTAMSENSETLPPCTILLIEDDEDDVYLFERAFALSAKACRLATVSTIADGMAYLRGHDRFADRQRFPLPNLIITDLGFRGDSGLHFLNWIHYQSEFSDIPVLCITGSQDPEKLEQAKKFGAACIEKSAAFEDIVQLVRQHLPAVV